MLFRVAGALSYHQCRHVSQRNVLEVPYRPRGPNTEIQVLGPLSGLRRGPGGTLFVQRVFGEGVWRAEHYFGCC